MIPRHRDRDWSHGGAFRFALLLLALEAVCVALLCRHWQALPLVSHGLISLVANAIVWRRGAVANAPIAVLRMSAMLLPFLGPLAPFAAAALLLAQLLHATQPPDAAAWHEHLFPNLAADPLNDQMDAIARRQPPSATGDDVESFYDVLRWGTLREREHVLSLISRSFRAEFAPVLREALASDDLGLRAQAAAGLSLLETRISDRLATLQRIHDEAEAGTTRGQAALALAQALGDAAHSGLYDELRAADMRREIVSLLTPIAAARPGDASVVVILGRTMIHLGEFDAAAATLSRAVEQAEEGGEQTDAAFGWLIEALFRQGNFARLAAVLAHQRAKAVTLVGRDGPLAPALSFWTAAT